MKQQGVNNTSCQCLFLSYKDNMVMEFLYSLQNLIDGAHPRVPNIFCTSLDEDERCRNSSDRCKMHRSEYECGCHAYTMLLKVLSLGKPREGETAPQPGGITYQCDMQSYHCDLRCIVIKCMVDMKIGNFTIIIESQ